MASTTISDSTSSSTEAPFTMGTANELKTLAQEIAQQTKSDIQEEVKAAAETFENEKQSFAFRLRLFLKNQIDKLGNAVIALIAAFIMALVMPFLVKLEMADEFGTISRSLDGLADDTSVSNVIQKTQLLSQNTIALEQQNADIYLAVSGLSEKINSLPVEAKEVDLTGVNAQLNELAFQQRSSMDEIALGQQNSLNALKAQISDLKIEPEKIGPSVAKLKLQLSKQLIQGQQLLNASAEDSLLREWITETHFLIGFIQLESTNLAGIQSTMSRIYQQEKPFEKAEDQTIQTLILLGALSKWVDLF